MRMNVTEQYKEPTVISLIIANLLPLIGVFFWDWEAFDVVFLYLLETLIVGFFTILKIITSKEFASDAFVHDQFKDLEEADKNYHGSAETVIERMDSMAPFVILFTKLTTS